MSLKSDEEYFPNDDFKDDDFTTSSNEVKKQKKVEKNSVLAIRPKKMRGHGTEAKRVNARLNGFDSENCNTWKILKEKFSSGITHTELKSLANLVCIKTGLKLDRDAVRDNRVLIKWFDENWETVEPILSNFHIHDQNGEIISSVREKEIENYS